MVAAEYLGFFDFTGLTVDMALRYVMGYAGEEGKIAVVVVVIVVGAVAVVFIIALNGTFCYSKFCDPSETGWPCWETGVSRWHHNGVLVSAHAG